MVKSNIESAKGNLIAALIAVVESKGAHSDDGERAVVALGRLAESPAACGFLAGQYAQLETGLLLEVVEAMAPAAIVSTEVRALLLEWIRGEGDKLLRRGKAKAHRAAMWALGKAANQAEVQQLLLDLLKSPWLAGFAANGDKREKESRSKKLNEFAEEVAQIAGSALAGQMESPLVLEGFAQLVAEAATPEFIRRGVLDVLSGRNW
ncbi:MAG: hypothetical protein V1806_06795 [Pseudomonadota bacterium]